MAVRDIIQAAAGVGGGDKLYVEDVFSTYLYTGNGSSQTINNGIDLAGEGGLVWIKDRPSAGTDHVLFDTARGASYRLVSNKTDASSQAYGSTGGVSAFNANGFSINGSCLLYTSDAADE